MRTAAVQNVRLIVAAASARGVPPAGLCGAAGIDLPLLLDPDGRLPAELVLRAWHVAAEMCGEPSFGLSPPEHVRADSYGGLGFAIHSSASLGEGLRRLS